MKSINGDNAADPKSSINWFPGHMRKALNQTSENLKLVDIVFETVDARIPFSSRNPELNQIIGSKPHIILLNKADLADPDKTNEWVQHYRKQGIRAIPIQANRKGGIDSLKKAAAEELKDLLDKAAAKGRTGRPIRAMVVGVPNTGKSTLINALSGKKSAVTGDRPGVTRAPKWIKTDSRFDLMDMPGVLWPKIQSKRSGICLVATGAVKEEVIDVTEAAYETMKILNDLYPALMMERYKVELPAQDDYDTFQEMARKRGCLMSGGRIDEERFARLLLDDVQAGRIGRITLEVPVLK